MKAGRLIQHDYRRFTSSRPDYVDQSTEAEILVTGIKVVDLARALRQGR